MMLFQDGFSKKIIFYNESKDFYNKLMEKKLKCFKENIYIHNSNKTHFQINEFSNKGKIFLKNIVLIT